MRNSGIPQDFESAGSGILQKLQLSFLEILKFLGAQFSVVQGGGWIFSGIAHYQFQASGQGQKFHEICVKFNKFRKAHCELDSNVCYYNRLHKCQVCYNWGRKALNHHNRSNSSTIIKNSSFNSARSTSVSGARPVKNYNHAHVASGDVDQCFGNDNQQISGINNGVNITTDIHCQNSDLTSVLSNMNNSLQSLSVRMEKMERSSTPKRSVSPPAATGKDLLQAPTYSCPAITAIPNHITFSDLDLANKNIL